MFARFTTLIAALFIAAPVAATTLDTFHDTTDNPNDNTALGIGSTELGQTFTVGTTGILTGVEVNILRAATTPTTAPLSFNIRSVTGGVPGPNPGDVLTSSPIDVSSIGIIGPQPYPWTALLVDISAANLAVTAGDTLAFTFATALGNDYFIQTDNLDAFAGGSRWSRNGTGAFFEVADRDLAFRTFVHSDTPVVPLPASLPLLLVGAGALVALRRRATKA